VLVGLAVPRYMQSTKTAKRTTFDGNLDAQGGIIQ